MSPSRVVYPHIRYLDAEFTLKAVALGEIGVVSNLVGATVRLVLGIDRGSTEKWRAAGRWHSSVIRNSTSRFVFRLRVGVVKSHGLRLAARRAVV